MFAYRCDFNIHVHPEALIEDRLARRCNQFCLKTVPTDGVLDPKKECRWLLNIRLLYPVSQGCL